MSFNDRINALNDMTHAHRVLNPDVPNAALWVKKNILEAEASVAEVNMTALENADVQADKFKQVAELYDAMVKDVYDEMGRVFGTRNDVSAQATASTYEAMAARPANYVGNLGLVDEAAVLAYANTKIAEADAYAVFRLNRIAQFQAAKDAVLNS